MVDVVATRRTGRNRVSIAYIIKSIRESRGLTQTELARRAGVAKQDVHNLESGRQTASMKTLARLAPALKTSGTLLLLADKVSKANKEIKRHQMSRDEALMTIRPLGALLKSSEVEESDKKFLRSALNSILPAEDGASSKTSKKSAAPVAGDRDGSGVKRDKPFATKAAGVGAERDVAGIKTKKPFAPDAPEVEEFAFGMKRKYS
jgi:transcriptional regulator with XRE-family HTH domain